MILSVHIESRIFWTIPVVFRLGKRTGAGISESYGEDGPKTIRSQSGRHLLYLSRSLHATLHTPARSLPHQHGRICRSFAETPRRT